MRRIPLTRMSCAFGVSTQPPCGRVALAALLVRSVGRSSGATTDRLRHGLLSAGAVLTLCAQPHLQGGARTVGGPAFWGSPSTCGRENGILPYIEAGYGLTRSDDGHRQSFSTYQLGVVWRGGRSGMLRTSVGLQRSAIVLAIGFGIGVF